MSGVLLHTGAERLRARRHAVAAMNLAQNHAGAVHYTQGPRRWEGINNHLRSQNGDYPHYADCSSLVTWAFWTATREWDLPDFVNGEHWNAGYTGSMASHGERVRGAVHIGDIALYGPAPTYSHVAMVAGHYNHVPMVYSHGSEGGPYFLPLHYRSDLGQVRRMIR